MKRTGPTNNHLLETIRKLKESSAKEKVSIWKKVAIELERPTRQRRSINLSRINRFCNENDIIVVPGKVLSSGDVNKKITIAAWSFSSKAIEKLEKSKSKVMKLEQLIKENPKGKNLKIIG
ncbi:MAG TPA: 50S ribosomal protein L18e [Candidatus Woesearchaeota archaeon]|jgi:large subunit ribosomal protein L18e|nr:50S ribosomal protein L18e [Candidatus Woesearchaeota archaeon]